MFFDCLFGLLNGAFDLANRNHTITTRAIIIKYFSQMLTTAQQQRRRATTTTTTQQQLTRKNFWNQLEIAETAGITQTRNQINFSTVTHERFLDGREGEVYVK